MEQTQEEMVELAGILEPDVVALIFRHLTEPQDVLSAASVCRTWRAAANDMSQLRAWQFDDDLPTSAGTKASATPMQPKTPLPKHWVNPTTHSPFSAFKTPKSLASVSAPSPIRSLLWPSENRVSDGNVGGVSSEESGPSPRTPSPVQPVVPGGAFLDIVMAKMVMGKYMGDLDISSSRLSDKSLQAHILDTEQREDLAQIAFDSLLMRIILKSCPHLHTLRLQHLCVPSMYPSSSFEVGPSPLRVGDVGPEKCEQVLHAASAFSLFLSLFDANHDHVIFRKVLRQIMTELGALPKLNTLSVELRMPSFGQSLKSQLIWQEHTHCSDKELLALLDSGPPPLSALALNRCDLTESSISALATACPNLEAIDLRSSLDIAGEHGIPPTIGTLFQGMISLTAAALGIFQALESIYFETWTMPALKRLRLETTEPLSLGQLQSLKTACTKLESLHLISGNHAMLRESHIYPITDDTILEHINNL